MMVSADLTHAKMPPAFIHAPGLFRSVKRGTRAQALDVTYLVGQMQFRFVVPTMLGVDDMRVLQGLVALACVQNSHCVSSDLSEDIGSMDKVKMLLSRSAAVSTTYNKLARELGYRQNSSGTNDTIRNALARLFTASVFIGWADQPKSREFAAGHIFERLFSDEDSSKIAVTLCPLLAFSVLGGPGEYLRLDMEEVRKLGSDVSRLLHMRLHWINPGQSRTVSLDKLVAYVYVEVALSGSTLRTRRHVVREAMAELNAIGWVVTPVGRQSDFYSIVRPAPVRRRRQRRST